MLWVANIMYSRIVLVFLILIWYNGCVRFQGAKWGNSRAGCSMTGEGFIRLVLSG